MTQLRRTSAALIAGLGVVALLLTPSLADDEGAPATVPAPEQSAHMGPYGACGYAGQACPWGMMGRGMHHHPMGHYRMGYHHMGPYGMGYFGMRGPGVMGPGMMGHGMTRPGYGATVVPDMDLTTEDVRHFLQHQLAMQGNPRLKLGEIKQTDDDTIVADIVTTEGALVDRYEVDRHDGQMQRAE